MTLNEEEYNRLAAEVVSRAKSILNNEDDYLDNIFRIKSLCHEIGGNDFDEDFRIFTVITSETDHIPYGTARGGCSEKWLAQCDKELSELQEYYRDSIEESCYSIIKRFSN